MAATSKSIESLVQNIVEAVHPLKIILFGSYARGKANPESDIDVLVVMPEGIHCRRTAQLLYRQIKGLGIPFDILVSTPTALEKHKDNIGLIYRTVLKEGREIYAS
jgi:predicted nucleotidyltransferase